MITDHVWRPPPQPNKHHPLPAQDRPCEYLNCRQPENAHQRTTTGSNRRTPKTRKPQTKEPKSA